MKEQDHLADEVLRVVNRDDLSIHGVRLGQDISSLQHLADTISWKADNLPGLAQWEWTTSRNAMTTPTKIHFVHGKVCVVKGSALRFQTIDLGRGTPKQALLDTLPGLSPHKTRWLSDDFLCLETISFRLSITMRPTFKSYLLEDVELRREWKAIARSLRE